MFSWRLFYLISREQSPIINRLRSMTNYKFHSQKLYQSRCICTTQTFSKKRKSDEEKKQPHALKYPSKSSTEPVNVWRNMTIRDVAKALGKDLDHVFEVLGFIPNSSFYTKPNSVIDNPDVIRDIVNKSGRKIRHVAPPQSISTEAEESKDVVAQPPSPPERLSPRPPVVTIMGHVDHGKTSLLDALRHTNVVDSEFGGITQHIGAFAVKLASGETITFLDTPGHAAFSAMRERGANVTDIVVLVVAADDGVMEQTIESIRMANNAKVPMIVAINKVDKPNADIGRTKKMLSQQGVHVEDLGGEIQVVEVSAMTGHNLPLLAETIVLQAELLDLKADYNGNVEAVVVESRTDPGRGKLSTAIVKRGTLRKGTILVAGTAWAKVRAMFDEDGRPVEKATPSTAVQVIGWRELPACGDLILEVDSEKRANEVVRWRQQQITAKKVEGDLEAIKKKEETHQIQYRAQLEAKRKLGRFRVKPTGPREKEIKEDTSTRVNIIIKGDVAGSVEAILDVIGTYDCEDQCHLDVVHYGVGAITENDIELAAPFRAVVYAFNVEIPRSLQSLAQEQKVTVRKHNVIYKLIDDLKNELSSKLVPKDVEDVIGEGKIQQAFMVTEGKKKVPVAGSRCTRGELKKDGSFKLIRDGNVIYDGKVVSMRHMKNEVGTVKRDIECGLMFEDPPAFEPGDSIICYKFKKEPQLTAWDPGF